MAKAETFMLIPWRSVTRQFPIKNDMVIVCQVHVASCAFRIEDFMRYLSSCVCPARKGKSYCCNGVC